MAKQLEWRWLNGECQARLGPLVLSYRRLAAYDGAPATNAWLVAMSLTGRFARNLSSGLSNTPRADAIDAALVVLKAFRDAGQDVLAEHGILEDD